MRPHFTRCVTPGSILGELPWWRYVTLNPFKGGPWISRATLLRCVVVSLVYAAIEVAKERNSSDYLGVPDVTAHSFVDVSRRRIWTTDRVEVIAARSIVEALKWNSPIYLAGFNVGRNPYKGPSGRLLIGVNGIQVVAISRIGSVVQRCERLAGDRRRGARRQR